MTDPTAYQPERGNRVIATLYHSEGEDGRTVHGTYVPRDDHATADPPAGAAWVDTGDPQGPLMVDVASVRPDFEAIAAEEQAAKHRHDLRAVRDAAQHLADTVRAAISHDLTGVARVQLPALARLEFPRLVMGSAHAEPDDQVSDPRHVIIEVRTCPVLGQNPEIHTYSDDHGLTWQTYGQEHDYSTDRLLEIVNSDGDQVASYPPGSWLHVRYVAYRRPDGLPSTS